VGDVEKERIRTPDGGEVPFHAVAEIELEKGPTRIRRFDGERAIRISAEVDKDNFEPGKILSDILEKELPPVLAAYPGVRNRLSGASQSQQDVQGDLMKGGIFALFLIYALMAIPLKSYSQPLLIMSVIPFGTIGALGGHLLLGLPVSMLSFFGIIALSGVVVNDSLILVDFVNRAKRSGKDTLEAVMAAAKSRFRAILLTSLTTFLGLAPIVFFESSLQAQIVIPMATSLAFGIAFATVITLFLIPCLYIILEDYKAYMREFFAYWAQKLFGRWRSRDDQAVQQANTPAVTADGVTIERE